jgi:FkbM family methyltransferase
MDFSYQDCYLTFLNQLGFSVDGKIQERISGIINATEWDEPVSGCDWNNIGVIALIQALEAEEEFRETYVEIALNAFTEGIEEDFLCKTHWVLLHFLIDQAAQAEEIGFSGLLELQPYLNSSSTAKGLIFIPPEWCLRDIDRSDMLRSLFDVLSREHQVLNWLSHVLARSQLVFYSPIGRHFLNLWVHLNPNSAIAHLQLGIGQLMNQELEGILFLHQSHRLNPNDLSILRALYIAYKDLEQIEMSRLYFEQAEQISVSSSFKNEATLWKTVTPESSLSYVLFDEDIVMAVQPSFHSIVTGALLAEGDWFEKEMEFWRYWLKPGMTVIDVGANVGVYTFSAAKRVGKKGKVIAIEPFSKCVDCLHATTRINGMDWVKVYESAASDREGTVRLSIQGASELNEVVDENVDMSPDMYTQVSCMTLDSLIGQEEIQSIDIMKLDAEGHELNVLRGCTKILSDFSPLILYENIAGLQGSNLTVADYLQQRGYILHTYKSFIRRLVPCKSLDELEGQLNIIAVPNNSSTSVDKRFPSQA